ncbi:MAG: hypothetical protein ACI9JN_002892 [Bacteroidia bacterium]
MAGTARHLKWNTMRTFFQINICLQILWILGIVMSTLSLGRLEFIAAFMIVTQWIFSFALLIGDGLKSKLIHHFYLSGILLLAWFLIGIGTIDLSEQLAMLTETKRLTLFWAPQFLLAIHFMYISFNHLNPVKSFEHNVFDL